MRIGIRLGRFSISQRIGGRRRRGRRRTTARQQAPAWTHPGCGIRHRSEDAARRCKNGRTAAPVLFEEAAHKAALQELESDRRYAAWRAEAERQLKQMRREVEVEMQRMREQAAQTKQADASPNEGLASSLSPPPARVCLARLRARSRRA